MFFALSGYLIIRILPGDLAAGGFLRPAGTASSARVRDRHLCLPALCLAWVTPDALRDFGQSVAVTMLFSSNILFRLKMDYFATSADSKPLLHSWSLVVDEQFYLVFPLLLAVVSLGFSEWVQAHAPAFNFFFPLSRMWELFTGVICALLLHTREVRLNGELAAAGLGGIVVAVFVYDTCTPFPLLYALLPVGLVLAGRRSVFVSSPAAAWRDGF